MNDAAFRTSADEPAPESLAPPVEPTTVYVWFVLDDNGQENIAEILTVEARQGLAYRPLMALDLVTADKLGEHAQHVANSFGTRAVLREFELVSILRTLEPQDEPTDDAAES